jgi:hypothetical protein
MRGWRDRRFVVAVVVAVALSACSNDEADPQWLTDCVEATARVVPGDPSQDDLHRYCTCAGSDLVQADVEATEECKQLLR